MKIRVTRLLSVLFICVLSHDFNAWAATFTSVQDGDWHDPATWTGGPGVPTPNDDVVINHRVISTFDIGIAAAGRVTINSSGTFTFTANLFLVGFLRNDGLMTGSNLLVQAGGPTVNMENYGTVSVTNVTLETDGGAGGPTAIVNYNEFLITNNLNNEGFFNNQRSLTVEGEVTNDFLIRCETEFSMFTVGQKFLNNPPANLELEGRVKLGLSDNNGNPLSPLTDFENRGMISKIGDLTVLSGIFDGNNTANVINAGQIDAPVYLCLGPQSSYENQNPPDDFLIDCCISLVVDAGRDRIVCSGLNVTLGGAPTAIGGTGPYDYAWTTTGGNLVTNTDANPQAFTNVNSEFQVAVEDNAGCIVKDIVRLEPITSVIAKAGDDKYICQGQSVTIGAIPAASCGTGPYTYEWSPVTGLTDPTDPNPTATPATTTQYQLQVTSSTSEVSYDFVTVHVAPNPTTANAGADKSVCGNFTNLEGNAPSVGSGTWSLVSGTGGNITSLPNHQSGFSGNYGTTYHLRWTIVNGSCGNSSDDVFITFDETPTTANAGANKSVCGTSTNLEGNTPTIGTGQWSIISGTGGGFATDTYENSNFTGNAGETYQLRWTISNGSCTSTTDDVLITFDQTPTTANAGPDKNVCGSTNLEGNNPVIGTGTWSIITGTGGIFTDDTNENTNFTGNAGETYQLRWTISNGSCTSTTDDVTITFDQTPTTANAGADKSVCGTSTNLEGNNPAIGTGTWSIITGTGGNFTDDTNENTNFTGNVGETYQLRWTISNGSCTSTADDVLITFDQAPSTANAGADKSVCGTSTNLEGNNPAVGTGTWSIITGTGGIFTDDNNENTNFTGNVGETYQLRWTISNGSCTSTTDDVTITFDQTPTTANAGPDKNVCGATNLEGNAATVGTGAWTTISGSGGNIADPANENSSFTGTPGVTYQLRWTISNGSCASTTDVVSITFDETPTTANAGPDKNVCGPTNLEANWATVGTGAWTTISGSGGNIADPTDENSGFTGTPGVTYQLRWTISNGSCPSSSDDVLITFDETPTTANAGADKNVCGASNLEGNTPVTGTGEWDIISGTGGSITNVNNPTSGFSGTPGQTYQLRWTIDNGSCASSTDNVTITIDENPTTANAGADKSVCGNATSLEANTPAIGVGTWGIVSGTGGMIADPADENSGFTGTPGQTYQLRWTISNGSCTSSSDDVNITFDQAPTTASAGPDKNVCGATNLEGNTPTVGTGVWSVISGTGPSIANVNNATTNFTGVPGETYQLRWTISNGSCPSSEDDVIITIDENPTTANAGADKSVCGNSTNLEANAATVGIGGWTIITGAGGNIADPTDENSGFTGTPGETYQLRWTISNGSCPSSTDDVSITFDQTPTTANAGPDKNVCGPTNLEGNAPTIGTGVWTIITGAGGSIANANNATSNFTGNPGETYQLRWTISNGSCVSSTDDVNITFDQAPTVSIAGADKSVCGTSTNLEANTPTIGVGGWGIVSGTGGMIADVSNPSSSFSGTPGATYQLRWTTSNGTCANSTDDVIITFDQDPTTANAGPDKSICGASTNLEGNAPTIGTGEWAILSGTGGSIGNINNETSGFTGTAGETYQLRWTISNGSCASSIDDVTITFDQAPTISKAGADKSVCGNSTNLEANTAAVGTGTWSIVSGTGGSITNVNNPTSGFSGNPGETYQLRWTISNGSCTNTIDEVTITFDQDPTTANAGIDQGICGTSTNLDGNTPAIGTGVWSIISGTGGMIADANNPTSNFSGIAGETYQLTWTIGNGSCTSTSDNVIITFDENPTTANAGPDKNVCGPTNLEANWAAIGTGTWSIVSGLGGSIGAPNDEDSGFTGIPGATYLLRWTISNGSCTSSSDDVIITFDETPTTANAGIDKSICGTSTNLEGNTPLVGTGVWGIISGTGGIITDVNNPNSSFSGNVGETYQLTWTISNGSCTSSSDGVNITFDETPTTANAGPDKNICGNSTNLEANVAAIGTGIWSVISGTGGIITTITDGTSNFTGVPGETYVLRWTISNGSCISSADDVTITFDQNPTTANAGTDKNVCGSTNLEANIPTVGTGSWNIITGTGGNIADTNNATSSFTGVAGESYQLRWTISNGTCTSSSDDVTITFDQPPTAANAGTDKNICGASTNLEANAPAIGTGSWGIISGAGGSITDLNNETSGFTGTPGETYQLRWTISNGTCVGSSDEVTITFDQTPTTAVAGADQDVCGTFTSLSANTPTAGSGSWSIVNGDGGGNIGSPNSPNSTFTGNAGQTYTLRWAISNGSCTSSTDDVDITLDQTPTVADAGLDQNVCGGATNLEGNAAAAGVGTWSIISGTGGSIANINDENSNFSGTPGATYQLRWTISSGSCGDTRDDVTITFDQIPTSPDAGFDKDVCITSTTLEGNTPTVGIGRWTIISGPGDIADPNEANTSIRGLIAGQTTTVAWQINNGVCELSDEFSINVLAPASVNTDRAEICEGESVSIGITGGDSFQWVPSEGVSNGNTANPELSPTTSTDYELTVSNGGCSDQVIDISVTVNPAPVAEVSEDATINGGEEIQLFASGGGTYSWSPVESLDNPESPEPLAFPTRTTTYTVEVMNEFGCTTTETVTITIDDNYEIFVPQMFSPNGDGSNDILFVNTIGIEAFTMKVFDRHGKLIFESNDPGTGWDGRFNGSNQNIDTYVYVVVATTYSNQNITEKGTFLLVR